MRCSVSPPRCDLHWLPPLMVTCHKPLTCTMCSLNCKSKPTQHLYIFPVVLLQWKLCVLLTSVFLNSIWPLLSSPYTHRWLFLFVFFCYFHLPRALPILGKNWATYLTHQGFRVKITFVGGRKRKRIRREKKADGPTSGEDKDGKASFSFFFFFSSLCSWMDMLLLLGGGQAAQRQVDGQWLDGTFK